MGMVQVQPISTSVFNGCSCMFMQYHAILFQQFFFQDGNFTIDQFQECRCMKVQIQPVHPKKQQKRVQQESTRACQ